ncbi:FMN-binding protein [Thermosulfuriphilus sp.]
MREFLKITLNLFVISLVAAGILGFVFLKTEAARKANEKARKEEAMVRLLGLSPEERRQTAFYNIYRYLLEYPEGTMIGYLFKTQEAPVLIVFTPEGRLKELISLNTAPQSLEDEAAREEALQKKLGSGVKITFTDNYIVATLAGKRLGYFIVGRTQGFKTWIKMMIALSPDYTLKGLEILEQEEDPGLGGEIEREYFKNQFIGKTLKRLMSLKVIKKPLPEDYRRCLERSRWPKLGLSPEEAEGLCQKYINDDIYAITGATISSSRVTEGVKRLVRAFVRRMNLLDQVIKEKNLKVSF